MFITLDGVDLTFIVFQAHRQEEGYLFLLEMGFFMIQLTTTYQLMVVKYYLSLELKMRYIASSLSMLHIRYTIENQAFLHQLNLWSKTFFE